MNEDLKDSISFEEAEAIDRKKSYGGPVNSAEASSMYWNKVHYGNFKTAYTKMKTKEKEKMPEDRSPKDAMHTEEVTLLQKATAHIKNSLRSSGASGGGGARTAKRSASVAPA